MKKLLFIISFFLFHPNLQSQNWSFGPTFSLGTSYMDMKFNTDGTKKFGFTKSGSFGFFTEIKIVKFLNLGSELKWVQLESKCLNSFNFGFRVDQRFHYSNLALPVYLSLSLKKFSIKGGIQPMRHLFGSFDIHYYAPNVSIDNYKGSGLKSKKINLGYTFGLDFNLTPHLKIRADLFYVSRTNDLIDYPFEEEIFQATVGVNRIFYFKGQKDK